MLMMMMMIIIILKKHHNNDILKQQHLGFYDQFYTFQNKPLFIRICGTSLLITL